MCTIGRRKIFPWPGVYIFDVEITQPRPYPHSEIPFPLPIFLLIIVTEVKIVQPFTSPPLPFFYSRQKYVSLNLALLIKIKNKYQL